MFKGINTAARECWRAVRPAIAPSRRVRVEQGQRPEDAAVSARRRRVAAHALWTLLYMWTLTAGPLALVWLAWSSTALGEDHFTTATKVLSSLREARTRDQHLFILPLVGAILVSSYFFVFQRLSQAQSDTDDTQLSLDASSERTFMGIQLSGVLVLAVIASSWMAIPPAGQSVDWGICVTGLTFAYLCSSLARLLMSDHIRALQWTTAQWEDWAQDKARRAVSLREEGTERFGVRSAAGVIAYSFLPLSLCSIALAALLGSDVLQTWIVYAFAPGWLLALDFFVASFTKVSGKWVALVVWRLVMWAAALLIVCGTLLEWGAIGLFGCTIWLCCLWYSVRAVSNRYGAEMDLRHLEFSTSKPIAAM